jgi:O-acetyl-ADP-ribose deacetylase
MVVLELFNSDIKKIIMLNRIEIVQDDITKLQVDAIVNAANSSLLGGGGVDGSIHRAAGPDLVHECRLLGGCKTGKAKATRGYKLPAKWIIHTVGPVWRGGFAGEPELLAACYRCSFKLAVELEVKTVAFPAISCGIYGYPVEEATQVAIAETVNFLESDDKIEKIIFTCFSEAIYQIYAQALSETVF